MIRSTKIFISLVAVMAMVASVTPITYDSAQATAPLVSGRLNAWCVDSTIYLEWGSHPDANSNGLQKGDMHPSDPQRFWDWLPTTTSQRTYRDYNVTPGQTYWYRVKYRPELPSNIVAVTCPLSTPTPTPTPLPTIQCRPAYQSAQSGEWVTFSAHRSYSYTYPYHQLTWRAVGGQPSSGTGDTFGTRFYTNSINETRVVTVSDGYRTATCSVFVYGNPVSTLTISPTSRTINSGDSVTFYASGGNGTYQWVANDAVPSRAWGSQPTFRFMNSTSYTQARTVTVSSGSQSRSATIWVRPHAVPTLTLSPASRTVNSGEMVTFYVSGGTGQYVWRAPNTAPYTATGTFWSLRFTNTTSQTRMHTISVTSGNQSRSATIWVRPAYVPTPTPTHSLTCYPSVTTVDSGQEVILRAWGGDGSYTWNTALGYPSGGQGASFATRFSNNTTQTRSYWVTVQSAWYTNTCEVRVLPQVVVTPTPTPYPTPYTTPTPTPYVYERLDLSQEARNMSTGQIAMTSSVRAKGNDTVQISMVVRNTHSETVHNVRLTDLLPAGLDYILSSTAVNGLVVSDNLTSSGLSLGSLAPDEAMIVQLSVIVDPAVVPTLGTKTLHNTAQVRADGTNVEVSRLPIILSTTGLLGTASTVKTGIGDSIAIASLAALAAAMAYALYTRTTAFNRKYALARVRKIMRDKDRLNFARLVR